MQPQDSRVSNVEYHTADLHQAAFILARGFQLLRLDGQGRRRTFVFDGRASPEAEAFYRHAQITARDYANALRDLKALLHQSQDFIERK